MTYGNAMKYATETIRDSAKEFLHQNLPGAITAGTASALGVPSQNPVFFCNGLFINTDDGYESYVQVDGFSSYTYNNTTSAGTWTDMTTDYLTGLLS